MKNRRGWAGIDPPTKLDSPSDCLVKMPYEASRGAESPKDLEAAMRLVAAACTLVVVAFLAVFGAILLHERTIADPASFGPSASTATARAEPATLTAVPVTLASAIRPSPILPEPQAVVPDRPPVQTFAQAPARPAPPPASAA